MSSSQTAVFSSLNFTPATQVRGNDGRLYDVPSLDPQGAVTTAKAQEQATMTLGAKFKQDFSKSASLASDDWVILPQGSGGFDPEIPGYTSALPVSTEATHFSAMPPSTSFRLGGFGPEVPSAPPLDDTDLNIADVDPMATHAMIHYPQVPNFENNGVLPPPTNPSYMAPPTETARQEASENKPSSWLGMPSFLSWRSKTTQTNESDVSGTPQAPVLTPTTSTPTSTSAVATPTSGTIVRTPAANLSYPDWHPEIAGTSSMYPSLLTPVIEDAALAEYLRQHPALSSLPVEKK